MPKKPPTKEAPAKKKAVAKKPETPSTATSAEAILRFFDVAALADPNASFSPGASDAELGELAEALGFPLDEGVRTALALVNGCLVSGMWGEGLMSTKQILEQWRFFEDPRPLLPFAVENGVVAYVVLEPGKHFGAVAEWDHDGDAWGDFAKPAAKSFVDFLAKREKQLRGLLPKGLPTLEGLWKQDATIPDDAMGALEASLMKALAKKQDVSNTIKVLGRAPASQATLVEHLLDSHATTFLSLAEHEEVLAALCDRLDVDTVLRALAKREAVPDPGYQALLSDFSHSMERVVVTLIARDKARSMNAAASFPPSLQGGLALVLRRLGLSDTPISDALRDRIAREGVSRVPYQLTTIEGGVAKEVERPDDQRSWGFSLAVYFDSVEDCARRVVQYVLGEPEGIRFRNWVVAPAAHVCTPAELARVAARLALWEHKFRGSDVYDGLRMLVFPEKKLPPEFFVEAAAHVEGEAMRSELIWLAYRVAVDQGAPLPDHDALLRDPVLFYGTLPVFYQPVVQAMGERAGQWASLKPASM